MEKLKSKHKSIWYNTDTKFNLELNKVSLREKIQNERKIEAFRKGLFKKLKQVPTENEEKAFKDDIINEVKNFESSLYNSDNSLIDFFIDSGYGQVTEDFIKEAEKFDPSMDVMDIFQAIRNVWIMNSIQILYGMEVELTPSIFAYSMLYPYSDNYLDDSTISIDDKIEFNNRFRNWLLGLNDKPINKNEEHIKSLVKMIEDEYNRDDYPEVYESLLFIHKAQVESLKQQKNKTIPYEKDILGISFEKGGASVLADGYLVRGELTEDEMNFCFGYGVFLQIIDDLQDIEEDLANNHMTILSQLAKKYPLDKLINRLINFIKELFLNEKIYNSKDAIRLKQVIEECSIIMLFEAISKNSKSFSKVYIKEIESYSYVRFSYLKKIKSKLKNEFTAEDVVRISRLLGKV